MKADGLLEQSSTSTYTSSDGDLSPLVIVEGFLSSTAAIFWGGFQAYLNPLREEGSPQHLRRKVIFTSVGPVSSLHDRACELYYSLKGGTVDYGATHARENAHGRYGRHYPEGLYPSWSPNDPLHFLGHSMGGATVAKMLTLLRAGFFDENEIDRHLAGGGSGAGAPVCAMTGDCVASMISLSSPFRGTSLVYDLGERVDAAPAVRQLSLGSLVTKIVHVVSYLGLPPMLGLPDFHADSRELSRKSRPLSHLVSQLIRSDWAESTDATPYDVTFGASDERDEEFWDWQETVNGDLLALGTYFKSYTACMTSRIAPHESFHQPGKKDLLLKLPLYMSSTSIGKFDYGVLKPAPTFLGKSRAADLPEEYYANDGVVPLFSQWHPGECRSERCEHGMEWADETISEGSSTIVADDLENLSHRAPHAHSHSQERKARPGRHELRPGIFYVEQIPGDANHISIIPFWWGSERQKAFWGDIGRWLEEVEVAREAKRRTLHLLQRTE